MWAVDAYSDLSSLYGRSEEITLELITGSNSDIIRTRTSYCESSDFWL